MKHQDLFRSLLPSTESFAPMLKLDTRRFGLTIGIVSRLVSLDCSEPLTLCSYCRPSSGEAAVCFSDCWLRSWLKIEVHLGIPMKYSSEHVTPAKIEKVPSPASSRQLRDWFSTIHPLDPDNFGIVGIMFRSRLLAPFQVLERAFAPTLRPYQSSMLLPRTVSAPSSPSLTLSKLLPLSNVRHASHAAQGAANRHSRDPAGKRLGAKRTGGEYVVPGCIIFKQRGTKWFPGENCALGRDHTIYATQAGYVRYYLDPERHPDRKYIGICFEKEGKLPTPRNAPTRRKLNRVAVPRIVEQEAAQPDMTFSTGENGTMVASVEAANAESGPQLRPGYMYREANWKIGRSAEEAGITAKPYNRKNRWLAWRKRLLKAERAAQMKSLKGKKSTKKGKGGR